MSHKNRKANAGFTIIEVLIVLAIVGLIMLIVFLAVPALQRNSRNTQYKNDAASLLAATTEYMNNNNGTLPAASSSATAGSNAKAVFDLAKTKSITTLVIQDSTSSGAITPAFDTATIREGKKCPAAASGGATVTPTGSSARALVMVYAVEDSAGAVVAQCVEG